MPIAMLSQIEIKWTRRADPDPPISIGEAYDANQIYRYTWLRLGPITIHMLDRERARRFLKNLYASAGKALALAEHRPADDQGDDAYPTSEDDTPAFALGAHEGRVIERAKAQASADAVQHAKRGKKG